MVPATQLSLFCFFPLGFSFALIRTGVTGGGAFSAPTGRTKLMFVVLALEGVALRKEGEETEV